MGTSLDQLNTLANLFGLKLPTASQPKEAKEEEEIEIEEMSSEEIKELEEAIKKFKSRNV